MPVLGTGTGPVATVALSKTTPAEGRSSGRLIHPGGAARTPMGVTGCFFVADVGEVDRGPKETTAATTTAAAMAMETRATDRCQLQCREEMGWAKSGGCGGAAGTSATSSSSAARRRWVV